MRSIFGYLIVLAVAYLGLVLFREARVAMNAEVVDQSRVIMLFGALVLLGLVVGGIVVVRFIPIFGDWVGNLFFNPNERFEKAPHADALAAIARGDYEEAIAEYRASLEANPRDLHALSEIARLYCEKFDNPTAAAAALEDALRRDWPPDDFAFLHHRLADVAWDDLRDARRARELLLRVIQDFPGTKHSANAQHRLQEIDRQLATGD
jgi:tetratricopeptide (TPR) repeat protein